MASAVLAAADEASVVMPFTCDVKGGEVVVSAATTEQRYAISGDREERPFTACRSGPSTDCLDMTLHRFAMRCGARRVAWHEVAGLIPRKGQPRSRVVDGSLHLVLGREAEAPASPTAMGPHPPPRPRLLVLPIGFAPVTELGARIEQPPATAASDRLAALAPSLLTAGDAAGGADRAPGAADRSAGLSHTTVAGSDAKTAWTAVVEVAAVRDANAAPAGASADKSEPLWFLVALVLGSSLLLAVRWLRSGPKPAPPLRLAAMPAPTAVVARMPLPRYEAPASPSARVADTAGASTGSGANSPLPPVDASTRNGSTSPAGDEGRSARVARGLTRRDYWRARFSPARLARIVRTWHRTGLGGAGKLSSTPEAMFAQAETAVAALSAVGPLRDTLTIELDGLRARLAALSGPSPTDPAAVARNAAAQRTIVRDLERIRRIAESAAVSFDPTARTKSADQPVMPQTASEAYALLGVNPSVSDATLKKIVDALRMSWHPDHAADEADRRQREERTKQLNIAWDLVSSKRAA
ncbi:MAG: J domain-containing protein [Hyphomicrobiaceae bacterium]|nr:J domain-containing protein [Hyphomicrobiaceae bacterium]